MLCILGWQKAELRTLDFCTAPFVEKILLLVERVFMAAQKPLLLKQQLKQQQNRSTFFIG